MSTMPDDLLEKLRACDAHITTTSPQQGALLHVRIATTAAEAGSSGVTRRRDVSGFHDRRAC